MSDLEEGEIENSEPETDTAGTGDFNDERVIDQLVENGNETARRSSSPNICVTSNNRRIQPAEPVRHSANQSNKTNKKHFTDRRSDPKRYSRNSSPPRRSGPSTSSTWHASSNRQQPRAPPPESVIFPPSQSYDMSRTVDPSISRLQTLVTHTRPGVFYPIVDVPPPIFFPSPPVPLLNLPVQPPPPPLIPHVDYTNQLSPAYFRGGNFDAVAMDESYDTDYRPSAPAQSSSSVLLIPSAAPPAELPPAPQPETQIANGSLPRVSKASTSSVTSDEIVDTAEFRKKLIMDMMENKKRKPTPDLSSPKKNLAKKARRTSSSSTAKTTTVRKPSNMPAEPAVELRVPEPVAITTALSNAVPSIQVSLERQPSAPVPVIDPVPHVSRSLSAESSEEQLKTRLEEVEGVRENNRKKIIALNEEYRQTMKRMEELKTEIHDARDALKSAVAEKRQIQEWLDDKEIQELDVLFDESQFVGFRTPVIKVEKTPDSDSVNLLVENRQAEAAIKSVLSVQPLREEFAPKNEAPLTQHSFREPVDDEEKMSRTSSSRNSDSEAAASDGNVSDDEREGEGDVDTEDLNLESITSDESVEINHEQEEDEETETVVTGLSAEMSLREKLLAKCNMSTRQSPDTAAQVSSSSERAETCRTLLLSTCKFGYNGTCAKGRECTYLHLHQVNDTTRQTQILESILRDVLGYNDGDIEMAIKEVMYYLPHFRDFEKLVQYFLNIVMKQTPLYRNKLFEFFTNGR